MKHQDTFSKKLLHWYDHHGRDFPWRQTKDPYLIWVSEIIFQQTRISQGHDYYLSFIKLFSTLEDLALADEDSVLQAWQGLGYYRRALNMRKAAQMIVNQYGGIFPDTYDELLKLPGIGQYTAAAISSICFNEERAVVDGNVVRLLSRLYQIDTEFTTAIGKKAVYDIANKLLDRSRPGDYNQAIMDFGAMQCKASNPKCEDCIFSISCKAYLYNLQNILPRKTRKPTKTIRHFHYLLMANELTVLLQKRKEDDIWKGLYQLPLYTGSSRVNKKTLVSFFETNGLTFVPSSIKKVQVPLSQELTHQKIYFHFYRIAKWKMTKEDGDFGAYTWKVALNLPMPKALNLFFSNKDLFLVKNI